MQHLSQLPAGKFALENVFAQPCNAQTGNRHFLQHQMIVSLDACTDRLLEGFGTPAKAPVPRFLASVHQQQKIERDVMQAMSVEAVRQRFTALGFVPVGSSAHDFDVTLRLNMARIRTLIEELGMSAD